MALSYRCDWRLAQLFGREDVSPGVRPRLNYGGCTEALSGAHTGLSTLDYEKAKT